MLRVHDADMAWPVFSLNLSHCRYLKDIKEKLKICFTLKTIENVICLVVYIGFMFCPRKHKTHAQLNIDNCCSNGLLHREKQPLEER